MTKQLQYRWLVFALLLLNAVQLAGSLSASAATAETKVPMIKFRDVFDIEDTLKEQYAKGFRLVAAIPELKNPDAPKTVKQQYILFFEK